MPEPVRRRLPVLQTKDDDDGPPRPGWQWIGIGAVGTLLAWLLLAMIANPLAARVSGAADPSEPPTPRMLVAMVVANVLALALAAGGGGFLVGRFGGARARAREAALAGLTAAAGGYLLAVGDPTRSVQGGAIGWALLLVVVGAIGAGAAWLGGRRGVRGRETLSI
jgi:hypothetical protein